jgi:hypothetical protein
MRNTEHTNKSSTKYQVTSLHSSLDFLTLLLSFLSTTVAVFVAVLCCCVCCCAVLLCCLSCRCRVVVAVLGQLAGLERRLEEQEEKISRLYNLHGKMLARMDHLDSAQATQQQQLSGTLSSSCLSSLTVLSAVAVAVYLCLCVAVLLCVRVT